MVEMPHARIVLEVDENQHKSYNVLCDVDRMTTIMAAMLCDQRHSGKATIWIRFNPNGSSVDGA